MGIKFGWIALQVNKEQNRYDMTTYLKMATTTSSHRSLLRVSASCLLASRTCVDSSWSIVHLCLLYFVFVRRMRSWMRRRNPSTSWNKRNSLLRHSMLVI